jgi:L-asparaginase II
VVVTTGGDPILSGDAGGIVWWRSSAKPFQAMPLAEDGVADRFGFGDEELALACASHSSEPRHLEIVDRMLARAGVSEADLACGPHPPLSAGAHHEVLRAGTTLTPRWSNCSGKHAGMLALARHHGWPLASYVEASHPVQQRLLRSVEAWTGVPREQIALSVDGCATICYGLPLDAMARAWARFAVAPEDAPRRLRAAMLAHPFLVAGTGRPCTEIMEAWPGQVIAKIGAEGVYGAAIPRLGLGVALKVEDGDMRASAVALAHLLAEIADRFGGGSGLRRAALPQSWTRPDIRNTRGAVVGEIRIAGDLVFLA